MNTLETRFGLIRRLLTLDVLSDEDYEDVEGEKNIWRKNRKLLELMTTNLDSEEKFVDFKKALIDTGQDHIVKYLECDGGLSEFTQLYNVFITYRSRVIKQGYIRSSVTLVKSSLECD